MIELAPRMISDWHQKLMYWLMNEVINQRIGCSMPSVLVITVWPVKIQSVFLWLASWIWIQFCRQWPHWGDWLIEMLGTIGEKSTCMWYGTIRFTSDQRGRFRPFLPPPNKSKSPRPKKSAVDDTHAGQKHANAPKPEAGTTGPGMTSVYKGILGPSAGSMQNLPRLQQVADDTVLATSVLDGNDFSRKQHPINSTNLRDLRSPRQFPEMRKSESIADSRGRFASSHNGFLWEIVSCYEFSL